MHPNAALIGRPGGRALLATPALILDLPAFEHNLAAMAAAAQAAGLALRPHAKTHKSRAVAARQLAAGAVGLCVAKTGEAEALADTPGLNSLLVTSPVIGPSAPARLAALAARVPELLVVVDSPAGAAALSAAAQGAGRVIGAVVDIDPGIHRTGVADAAAALALARQVAGLPGLRFAGLQCYAGHAQHLEDYATRVMIAEMALGEMARAAAALRAAGLAPGLLTGGGTGTFAIEGGLGVLNELQAGSYAFMDVEYGAVALEPAGGGPFRPALFVDARVISANTADFVTLDAGFKAFATDGPKPKPLSGADFAFMGDEHGALFEAVPLGSLVTLQVPHCDPTVNLYDVIHVVEGDTLVDLWPIEARGRSY
ncbi:alanine racemase [Zavarzinia compransoris]|uniref:Threonine aldolase n=1 Tax=Zavarzinia compransoris TaxID=1264899 RepID=A0A317E452_9PROT|nr:alanine racemase [Zavarzinia compransoris]PWR19835.1 threonine aldolase [Zavarzinia compransoris]TDP45056.1 D-serine deaminase-like pyridoxal phosphate-dependent protein [Zavarzinia compransoris]